MKFSVWNIICIGLVIAGAMTINYTLMSGGILLFIAGVILKFVLKVDDKDYGDKQ